MEEKQTEGTSYTESRFWLDLEGILELVFDKLNDFELDNGMEPGETESISAVIDAESRTISVDKTRFKMNE